MIASLPKLARAIERTRPMAQFIADLAETEGPDARWLRVRGPSVSRAYQDMMQERREAEGERQ